MLENTHFSCLQNMYLAAPINTIYQPDIIISNARAEIEIELSSKYFHSAGAVHGSVYFKMLDDAAFFAANSLEQNVFVLTTSFTTYITRPISTGRLKAVGKVVNQNKSQFIVEAIAYDEKDNEIARGNGVFVRSKILLRDIKSYRK